MQLDAVCSVHASVKYRYRGIVLRCGRPAAQYIPGISVLPYRVSGTEKILGYYRIRFLPDVVAWCSRGSALDCIIAVEVYQHLGQNGICRLTLH